MPSLLDSPPQIPAAAGAWGSLYAVQEPVKPRHLTALVVPAAAAAAKPPASYGGARKKNLETCTEALGCETGAVDAALPVPACNGADDKGSDGEVEEEAADCAERKRRAREEEKEMEGRAARRPLPPPLTTLTRRGRMVHERRDGRLAVYAVRTPGVEAERIGGRLRMRLVISSLPSGGSTATCRRQEAQEAEAAKEEVVEEECECGVAKYVRGGGRCVEPEVAAAAARHGKQWEQEQMQAAAFWVATS